jgi:NADH dehydrogenase
MKKILSQSPRSIVIAGAGFAGITAALKLERQLRSDPAWKIILVDKNPYQLYTPALYEIAAIPKEEADSFRLKSSITIPITEILARRKITFIQGALTAVDRQAQTAYIGDRKFDYAFLILALGSETAYFDIPGLREYSLPLKRFEDGVAVRNEIERAILEHHEVTLAVGGAGATGVELISEFSNFLCYLSNKLLPDTVCASKLILVEASGEILPGFEPWIIRRARERLVKLGIEIRTNACITAVSQTEITLNHETRLSYDMLIWTGGVIGHQLYKHINAQLTDKKNCAVNTFLQIDNHTFAIGDAAGFTDPKSGKPLPLNVPVAEAQARTTAKNILREIAGKPKIPFRPLRKYPYILALGKKYAIADLVFIRFSGIIGWCVKLLAEFRYLFFILPFPKAIRIWLTSIQVYTSND